MTAPFEPGVPCPCCGEDVWCPEEAAAERAGLDDLPVVCLGAGATDESPGAAAMTALKRMTIAEFRQLGYLQEVNRRLLHPLGLALEVTVNADGTQHISDVRDCRDDPEGIRYGQGEIDPPAALRIGAELVARAAQRADRLGFVIQPAERA